MSEIHYYRRFKGYDYGQGASLFISISTAPRENCFGAVKEASVHLSPLGEEVLASIQAIPRFNPGVYLFGHVVMPNHTHFRLYLPPNLTNPLAILGRSIRRFKSYTTNLARKMLGKDHLWQQGYHDRLCLNSRFIEAVERYIVYNPLKYELFQNQARCFHIEEPLNSPRFDPSDYWKGIGNPALLEVNTPIAALRVSRSITDFRPVLKDISSFIRQGYVILSGFISPGEMAVRDMLLGFPHAKIILVLADIMPCDYKPDSRYLIPLQEGRFLVIARGNAPDEFSRQGCLQLNEEIIEIAKAGQGTCLYYQ